MKNKTIFLHILCCAVLIAGLIGTGLMFSKKTTTENKNSAGINITTSVKEFKIDAFRFGYNPNNIKVQKGDKVKIIINNTDTTHGIRIPELDVADNNVLEFTAGKSGQFNWFCNNFCGEGHRQMQGILIVNE